MPIDFAIAPADLAVLLVYLVGIVLFGIWVGRGQRNVTDYMLGGRNLPWWAILGSIVATETSTVTFLSVPGLAFAARASEHCAFGSPGRRRPAVPAARLRTAGRTLLDRLLPAAAVLSGPAVQRL